MPEAQEDEVVYVVTGDGTTLAVNKLVAYKSTLLKKIIRRKARKRVNDEPVTVTVERLMGDITEKIFEWCAHHFADYPQLKKKWCEAPQRHDEQLDEWDSAFFTYFSQQKLIRLIEHVHLLDIPPLMEQSSKAMANYISERLKDMDIFEFRRLFGRKFRFPRAEFEKNKALHGSCSEGPSNLTK